MSNELDVFVERYGTDCAKWDEPYWETGQKIDYYGVADMDFVTAKPIMDAMYKVLDRKNFGYTILNKSFTEDVSYWMEHYHNFKIEKEDILFASRIGMAIAIMINELTEINDEILIFSPGYSPLHDFVVKNNRIAIENELIKKDNKYYIDFEKLDSQITTKTKIMLLVSPHNPVGRVWTKEELLKIGEIVKKHNLIIISDEVHSELTFKNYRHYPIASLNDDLKSRTITCNSVTKAFNVPGLMGSNIIISNENLRNKVKDAFYKMGLHNPNPFIIPVINACYRECEDWLLNTKNYLEENYNFLKNYLEENIKELKLVDSEGTYLAWIDIRDLNMTREEVEKFFSEKVKMGIYTGDGFGLGGSGFIRLNLATQRERLKESLEVLKEKIDELR